MKQILFALAICAAVAACKKSSDTAPAPAPTPEPVIPTVFGSDTLGDWQKMSTGEFFSLSMISPAKGFVAALLSTGYGVYKTSDSGKTWAAAYPFPTFYGEPYIVFADEFNGFWSARSMSLGYMPFYQLVSQPGYPFSQIMRLSLPAGTPRYFFPQTICVTDTTGYTITDAGYLTRFTIRAPNLFFYTNLDNLDFSGTVINDVASSSNISFANMAVGGVAKNTAKNGVTKAYLRITVDSGKTWNRITPIDADDINHLSFYDANTITAMGYKNRLYCSSNSGATWSKYTIPGTNSPFYNFCVFVSPNRGFVAKVNEIYETQDGGASWTRRCKVGNFTNTAGETKGNYIAELQVKGGYLWARTQNSILRFKL